MAITGLENAYYPAHAPVPVQMTKISAYPNVSVNVFVNGEAIHPFGATLNSIDGIYRYDVAPSVRAGMARLMETIGYTNAIVNHIDPYISEVMVAFIEDDGLGGNTEVQQVTRKFIHATERGNNNIPYEGMPVKIWRCYPFSFRYQPETKIYVIPHSLNFSVPARVIEYVDQEGCCKGTYVKWLNEYGCYNYWLFPFNQEYSTEGENIFDMPRNVFDTNKTSNFDSVGFNATKLITIRDIVKEMYWFMFESLSWSPEVYILKNSWPVGSGNCGVNDWIKVRQSDVNFERIEGRRSMAELEFEFEMPKLYTITSL